MFLHQCFSICTCKAVISNNLYFADDVSCSLEVPETAFNVFISGTLPTDECIDHSSLMNGLDQDPRSNILPYVTASENGIKPPDPLKGFRNYLYTLT